MSKPMSASKRLTELIAQRDAFVAKHYPRAKKRGLNTWAAENEDAARELARLMKAIRPTLVPRRAHGPYVTVGAHYRASCPYCHTSCAVWPDDWEKRDVPPNGGARCIHFGAIDATGRFVFDASIKRDAETKGWWRFCPVRSSKWHYVYETRDEAQCIAAQGTDQMTWHVEAVTMPPREWLIAARKTALANATYYRKHAVWLAAEIAKT